MRRGLKVVAWVFVLAACAGVGAYAASRTDPFPPGVDDPGARPSGSASPSDAPQGSWIAAGFARSEHRLFVGGSCRTNWRIRLSLRSDEGRLEGRGTALLRGRARCDFPNAQLQVRRLRFEVGGRRRGSVLTLRFTEEDRQPEGSIDLGALLPLLDRLRAEIAVEGVGGSGRFRSSVSDGDRGTYTVEGQLLLAA